MVVRVGLFVDASFANCETKPINQEGERQKALKGWDESRAKRGVCCRALPTNSPKTQTHDRTPIPLGNNTAWAFLHETGNLGCLILATICSPPQQSQESRGTIPLTEKQYDWYDLLLSMFI